MIRNTKILEVKSEKEFIYFDIIDNELARLTYSIKTINKENIENLKTALDKILRQHD